MFTQDIQLDALGDSTRRAILARLLQEGPLPVGKLAEDFPVSRPAISQHLRVLKQARLVTDRAEGNRRLYQLDPAGFENLREYFEQFWGQALQAFQRKVAELETRDVQAEEQT
ncbi:MAG TPA: metalloregulator ArsR/SmtB family transcription factor [Dongiaceae bacterium]|nr:metalloregulator ArsR/SmtB family transcription factor [Dongiaceae bacterium]